MRRGERQAWLVVWLLCHMFGTAILTIGVLLISWAGLGVGLGILIISMAVITTFLDDSTLVIPAAKKGDRLVRNTRSDDDKIPDELGQAIRNANTDTMRAALHSNNPGQLAIALESALALIDTIKSLAKVVLR